MTSKDTKPRRQSSGKAVNRAEAEKRTKAKKPKKPVPKSRRRVKKVLSIIGTTLLSIMMIGIITGCIVVTSLTVYVMKFFEPSVDIDLHNLQLDQTAIVYCNDANGNPVEYQRLPANVNRMWVDYSQTPQCLRDAFVCGEDERFLEHDGVDWKRTFAAFANMILHFWDTQQGGSTITQQLVKNITKENEVSIERKVNEIFLAIDLEKRFTKMDILEAYMNVVPLDMNIEGVGMGANYYFGKDVSELTIAESAALVAITQNPYYRNPFRYPERNKERRDYILGKMYELNKITKEEYEQALTEELQLNENAASTINQPKEVQNWFVDQVVNEVIADLIEQYGYSEEYATQLLYNGGYKIYSTVDKDMQEAIEQKYLNPSTFSSSGTVKDPPNSAFVVMDYQGNLKAIVGDIGEKEGNRVWNNATMGGRSPGSAIKPLSVYGPAIDRDLINYSTLMVDEPFDKENSWPRNYDRTYRGNVLITDALKVSLNTIPVKLTDMMGVQTGFDFLTQKLHFTTLVRSDVREVDGVQKTFTDMALAPLSLGSFTDGVHLYELTAAYQIYGNGGRYYDPSAYYRVEDADGNVVLEKDTVGEQVISRETSYIMNKLMERVITAQGGTGTAARISGVPVVGKTGTTSDDMDFTFVGLTPDYVSAVWYGYKDEHKQIPSGTYYSSSRIWRNVMADILTSRPVGEFPSCDTVEEHRYCTQTGLLARSDCPSTGVGYYKSSSLPDVCDAAH